jgi:eukaryotic-like serine/threonine-protein kinase
MFEIHAEIRYQQIRPIGIGDGMNSCVFQAYDPYLQRELAVKEIPKSKLGNDFDSYCNEARAMFAVTHPNIVGLLYICETPSQIALALPYFANGSLKTRIKHNPLGLKALLKMAQGVTAGLARIHVGSFLHLDLKPANVLFDDSDIPLIGDFGQSRKVSAAGTVAFPSVYNWCMPPEVWSTHVATVLSDIYQLGVLLYRSANGDRVYNLQKSQITSAGELQNRVARGKFPDPAIFLPHVPRRIRTIIRKAMRVDPTNRYRSATDLAATLGRVPIPLDWQTIALGSGAYRWVATRTDKPDLQVELSENMTSGWDTKVWTNRNGDLRKKGVSECWREHLSYEQAFKHLTEVFAALGQ